MKDASRKSMYQRYALLSGTFVTIAMVATLIAPSESGGYQSTYLALSHFVLAAGVAFGLLAVAAWSWLTFDQGKKGEGEMASGWRRTLAAFGLVVTFVVFAGGFATLLT